MVARTRSWSVVTANVNGIRAADRRGGVSWLAGARPDVICLQEIRATHEQLHEVLRGSQLADWHIAHAPAPVLGRAGVAGLTREQPTAIRTSTRRPDLDGQGRWLEVDCEGPGGPVTIVSAYVHTGEAGTPRQADKYRFLAAMDARLATLARTARRTGREVVVCGDLNIAHHEVDIKNWRGNRGRAGFLEEERNYLTTWFNGPWVDLGRRFGGEGPGPYTWWSWRGRGFDTDGGWRIDYVLATRGLSERCTGVVVGKAATYDQRWSDHAPVTATFRR